jgi:diguanylate cyclase (GGDEF)-like protein
MRRLLARVPLLARFSLLSLLMVALIGLAVGVALHLRVEHRAVKEAERLAVALAGTTGRWALTPLDMAAPVDAARASQLDAELSQPLEAAGVEAVKVFNDAGTVVYATDHDLIGERSEEAAELAASGAVRREMGQGTSDDGSGARTLSVYVPFSTAVRGPTDGVLEVHLPYAPVAAAIAHDTWILVGLLALGLLVLWAVLYRIVATASRRLHRQAREDHLTGLPNRTELHAAGRALLAGTAEGRLAALLLIDLDRFKEINDTLGHEQGDALLREVADRLRGAVRPDDLLARLGADEFAILVTDLPHRGATAEVADRVGAALRRPFHLAGVALELDASIGIALAPDHGTDVATLLQRADVAMDGAKRGGARIETYDRSRDPYSPERLQLVAELRRAIEREEFVLHFQPKIAVATGEVTGAEALVRWEHPTRGLLGPIEFVPLAERTGVIGALTRWVLDAALAQCAAWRDEGLELPVAVTLSGADVLDAGLADMVADALERAGLPGHLLACEISEHTVLADPRRAADSLGRLRAMGVRLSLDDFGQGQSSLSYLKRLPLDELKIDRSFVMGMEADASDAAIVRATIDLGRGLGLRVVAEGVENDVVLADLAALSCDVAQGFGLSRPLPADELERWLLGRAIAPAAQTV